VTALERDGSASAFANPGQLEKQVQPDMARVEALLRAASLLLGRGDAGAAVGTLHAETRRALGLDDDAMATAYASPGQAQEQQRNLLDELSRQRARTERAAWREAPWSQFVRWVGWLLVVVVVSGLTLRYGYAIFNRWKWQRQYPDGPWISRYYGTYYLQEPQIARNDVAIDYDWRKGPPVETLARDYWSASWDTCLIVTSTTELDLKLYADDAGSLFVDETQYIRFRNTNTKSVKVTLQPGVHHVRVEYGDRRRGAKVKLTGIDSAGTSAYRLQRPVVKAEKVSCDELAP
jgi:hypothetical protein